MPGLRPDGANTTLDGVASGNAPASSGLTGPVAYDAGTTYAIGDGVTYLGSSYRSLQSANTGHTPGAGGSEAWWALLAAKGADGTNGTNGTNGLDGAPGAPGLTWQGAYNPATTYALNDAVSYAGASWRALQSSTGQTPAETAYWTTIAAKGDAGPAPAGSANDFVGLQSDGVAESWTPAVARAKAALNPRMPFLVSTGLVPVDGNHVLAIDSDTTDGSLTFTDLAGSPATITNNRTTTAAYKVIHGIGRPLFGASSLVFVGVEDYNLTATAKAAYAFGTGDFTAEAFVSIDGVAGNSYNILACEGFDQTGVGGRGTLGAWAFGYNVTSDPYSAYVFLTVQGLGGNNAPSTYNTPIHGLFLAGQIAHFAVSRQSGTIRFFYNGTLISSQACALTVGVNATMQVGARIWSYGSPDHTVAPFKGVMQGVRLSNVARYTASFTP